MFDNDSNRKRVQKMCETLDLIENSAAANKTPKEEVAEMINQLLLRVAPYANIQPTSSPHSAPVEAEAQPRRIGVSAPPWASVLDMAREASLPELNGAIAIYLNRLDEHFAEAKE